MMMLSSISDGRYDVDMQRFSHLKQSKKEELNLYSKSSHLQLNFWYRAPYRSN